MNQIKKTFFMLVCMILASAAFTSCEWDQSPEYDHPIFASYTISAEYKSFSGNEKVLTDIMAWVKANAIYFSEEINYKTGAIEEFAKSDSEAVTRFQEFKSMFKNYLLGVRNDLDRGVYGDTPKISATFNVFAKRGQGDNRDLVQETVEFNYP